jgi:CDP-diacylglycerol--glycerol-3-phosphate 3-phosphatidyltransferase
VSNRSTTTEKEELHELKLAELEIEFVNAPNLLTLARVALVPLVIAFLYLRTPTGDVCAALAFTVAAITDYFDGYLARRQKLVTVYGKLMDPLADKFLVVCSIVMLQQLGRIHEVLTMVVICRELAITSLRALASAEGVIIASSGGAKWKTAAQMVALPFIMAQSSAMGIPLGRAGDVLLYISVVLSLWSAKDYTIDFFKAFHEGRRKKALERKARRRKQP